MYALEGEAPGKVLGSPLNPFPNYAPNPPTSKFLPPPPKPKAAPKPVAKTSGKVSTATTKSSGKVGTSSGGTISPMAAAAPAAPVVDDYLNDDTYKTQHAALLDAMADYTNQNKLQADQYGTTYKQNTDALKKNREQSEASMTDDYASRGLLNSGIYTKAFTDLGTDYAGRQTGLDTDQANFLANLKLAMDNFTKDQGTQENKAKQDAINRRAAQFA